MTNQNRMHPEMAEPIIEQIILDYVNAGLRLGLAPDWAKFEESDFYEKATEKFTKEEVDKKTAKAKTVAAFPKPPEDGAPGSVIDRVIRDYVNAGLAVGLAPNWDKFKASQFYSAATDQFGEDAVNQAIANAKGHTDKLNVPLKDLFEKK